MLPNSARQLGFGQDPRFAKVLAPLGSAEWAEYIKSRLQQAVEKESLSVIEFAAQFEQFFEHKGWSVLTSADGRAFSSFRAFAIAPRPHGLGCSPEAYARLMQQAKRPVEEVVAEVEPIGEHGGARAGAGRPKTEATEQTEESSLSYKLEKRPESKGGTSADYLAARLKAEADKGDERAVEVLKRAEAGEFKSVRAAAIEAGIIKPPDPMKAVAKAVAKAPDPVAAIVAAVRRMSAEDRAALRDALMPILRLEDQ